MTDIRELLVEAMAKQGSDVFLVPGSPVMVRVDGQIRPLTDRKLSPEDTRDCLTQVYSLAQDRSVKQVMETGDDDFSFSLRSTGRFRCNVYRQRNSYGMVLRVMRFDLPNPADYHIPEAVLAPSVFKKGMVLVTGPAGSGKSTTLACMVDRINTRTAGHIITIEDPIEYLHPHKGCIVSQREVEHDTRDYQSALRAALRQSPDVILLGEMRDFATIQTALTAAETGQLVISSLHTTGAAKTVDRIVDVFPANQQQQVRIQLSMVLKAVVSQQLIPSLNGGMIPAFEIMTVNSAVQNLIREGKTYQMENVIFAGSDQGMQTMDGDILRLYREGIISRDNAMLYAAAPELMAKKMDTGASF